MKTIGVIGLGSIGSRHAKNIADLGHKVLSYDPEVAPGELQDVLRGSDAIVIAAPTDNHLPIMEHVLVHKKPIFVEKPLGNDFVRAQKVIQDADDKGIQIFVGNNLRFHACVVAAKKMVDDIIGEPVWANFTVGQYTDKHPYIRDGVTANWGAHEIDLALHLLGPAKVLAASIDEDDSIADINLRHNSGCRTTIHLDYVSRPEIRRFTVAGWDNHINCDLLRRACALNDNAPLITYDSWDQNYIDEMRAFIDRIDGKDAPGAYGREGLDALEIIVDARKMAGLA